nr:selenocysteine-specific translation elongation factor [uncultured Cetobacterium sp.]
MENIVIGTAGHIDHGKTTLIQKLTGIDTDVLPEEKKRGITINIGFSYLEQESGEKIGIIDVPGHEKFIKNMVAGVNGIHYLMMVIACDDGIMQQTKEHFNICQLLGIEHGIIVLTKTDLCTKERVEDVKKDIRKYFKGTFLENSEICLTSVKDENGYDNLKKIIFDDIKKYKFNTKVEKDFALSIDRVFPVKGFGVVVTGTSLNNTVKIGDMLTLYPEKKKVRVKKIENHGKSVEILSPGNRCALNLGGIELSDIKRGDILSKNEKLEKTDRIDCFFSVLSSCKKIKNNSQVRLNIGTKEIISKIKIFEKNELKGGETGYVQFELKEPIIAMENELGIIRSVTPVTTIGGIRIINVFGKETKRDNFEYLEFLDIKFKGNTFDNIILFLKEKNGNLVSEKDLLEEFANLDVDLFERNNEVKKIVFNDENYYTLKNIFEKLKNSIEIYFKDFYEKNSLKLFASRAEIKNKYFKNVKNSDFNIYLDYFVATNLLDVLGDKVSLKDYKISLNKNQKKLKDEILKTYKDFAFSPLQKKAVIKNYLNQKEFEEMFNFLVEKELLVYLGDDIYILSGFYKESIKILKEWFEKNKTIKLGEFKEQLNAPRRVTLLLLDRFDLLKITEKVDDYRILRS